MELAEYQNIFQEGEKHWWYLSLYEVVLNTLEKLRQTDSAMRLILDAGCGTGKTLQLISERFPTPNLIGLDISSLALNYCRKKKLTNLFQASVEALPFTDNSFDAVLSLDVLYHLEVSDDEKTLAEIQRVLKKGGYLILHLPAFECLRNTHDWVVHTRQRYQRHKLLSKMERAGFQIIGCTYRYMFLFPVLFFKKAIEHSWRERGLKSNIQALPAWLNILLYSITHCENKLIQYVSLPFGSSLFCLGKKR